MILLGDVVDLTIRIRQIFEELPSGTNFVTTGGKGQPITNPLSTVLTALSAQRNSLLRVLKLDTATQERDGLAGRGKKSLEAKKILAEDADIFDF